MGSLSLTPVSRSLLLIVSFGRLAAGEVPADRPDPVEAYNVVWDSLSKDSSGSMPLGNGDIGLNLWVEPNGDVLFYIAKTDAWDESGCLLKLGRVRIRLSPNPFVHGEFRQTLKLRQGEVEIAGGTKEDRTVLRVRVDANHPVVVVESEGHSPSGVSVVLEVWRTSERKFEGSELHSANGMTASSPQATVGPDIVLPAADNRIAWFHRNAASLWPITLKHQGMESWISQGTDPLMNRTFGGIVRGEGLVSEGVTTLRAYQPYREHRLFIVAYTAQTATPEEWLQHAESVAQRFAGTDAADAFRDHCQWWAGFWSRSWIRVSSQDPKAEIVSRGYALQRFISACAGRGAYPIKFNGSLFTVDARERDEKYDADYRRWGGPYWFQNTRLAYWPMLKAGDFEMMRPLFRMYRDAMPFFKARTTAYFGHEGAYFPETMDFWGTYRNGDYGLDRKDKPISQVDNMYIRRHYNGSLELLALMLDYYAYTQDAVFLKDELLPMSDELLAFWNKHWPRDADGRLRMEPAQSLETWQDAINPAPDIAGLRWVLAGLLALPDEQLNADRRERWARLLKEVPPLPTATENGKTQLLPAQRVIGKVANIESPQLYSIFPFRLFGVGKPDLETARYTFDKRTIKGNIGWHQDDTQSALLGLTDEARKYVSDRFSQSHPGSRFPAFWGPNYDWIPDQDHGCNGLMALQTMLLQADDGKTRLFPAWPKDWDVEFKLHAPRNTILEGAYRAGKLERLRVTPETRGKDVLVTSGESPSSRP